MTAMRCRQPRAPIVGVFDAGIGGLPLAAAIRRARPDVGIVYLADSARRPYGPQPQHAIKGYMAEVAAFFDAAGVDLWAVACNTASVAVRDIPIGRAARIDMVQAVRRAASRAGIPRIGLLATASTVASGVMVEALPDYEVTQVATEDLLRLAEVGSTDRAAIQRLSLEAIKQLRESGCNTAILACTDFTPVLPMMAEVAGAMTLIDPLEAARDLTLETIAEPCEPLAADGAHALDRLCLTGPHPVNVREYARDELGLELPHPEIVTLPRPSRH
jgi:glutamate racemase